MANAAKKTESDPFAECMGDPPKDFKEAGTPDIDGWYTAEPGLVVQGQIMASIQYEKSGQPRTAVLIRLSAPTKHYPSGRPDPDAPGSGGPAERLEVGQICALGVSHQLRGLLEYVEHQGRVWVKALEKKKLKNGNSVWKYDVRVDPKARKGAPPVALPNAAATSSDDAPF